MGVFYEKAAQIPPRYSHIWCSTKGLELITCQSLAVTLSVFISLLFPLYQIMYIFSIKFIYLFEGFSFVYVNIFFL